MDYKIAKYLFNQTTDEEAKETVERMDKNFTDEQIYRMYKEAFLFVERNCRGFGREKVDVAWRLYKKQFFSDNKVEV